ncbi:unnamed protein product [Rhizophagus irregularis]|nr:unnamed protein product [Rhizophagus irregularis]
MHYFNKILYNLLLAAVLLQAAQATTVTVVNNTGKLLTVNCASGNDNIGLKNLQDKESFNWSFQPNFSTLFYCDATQDGIKKHFDVYYNGINGDPTWSVTRNGNILEANMK